MPREPKAPPALLNPPAADKATCSQTSSSSASSISSSIPSLTQARLDREQRLFEEQLRRHCAYSDDQAHYSLGPCPVVSLNASASTSSGK